MSERRNANIALWSGPDIGRIGETMARKWLPLGAWPVFGTIALLVAVVRLEGGGSAYSWYGVAVLLCLPLVLHRFSKRSSDPWPVFKRELVFAAFAQGLAVALLEFRAIPSLAVIAPLAAFVVVGGLRQLLLGFLAAAVGAGLGSFFVAPAAVPTGPIAFTLAALHVLLSQLLVAFAVRYNDRQLLAAHLDARRRPKVDPATGLRIDDYLSEMLESRCADIVAALQDPGRSRPQPLLILSIVVADVPHPDRILSVVAHELLGALPEGATLVRARADELRAVVAIDRRDQALTVAKQVLAVARSGAPDIDTLDAPLYVGGAVFPFLPPRPDLFSGADVSAFARSAAEHAASRSSATIILIEPGPAYGADHFTSKVDAASSFDDLLIADIVRRVR